jgi:hypothetical protein
MLNRKKRKFGRLIAFAIVIGLCMTALKIGAISTTTTSSDYTITKIDSTRLIKERHALSKTITKEKTMPVEFNPIASYADTPVITTENDCQNPAIAARGSDILVIAEESQSILSADLLMSYSSNGGNSWSDIIYDFSTEDVREVKPVVDYCDNNEFQAYGTCLPDSTGTLYFLHFPSMTDPEVAYKDSEGWTAWETTLDFNDYYAMDIAGYPHGENAPAPDFHGILTLIGDSSYGETIENYYETEGTSIGACYLAFEGELGDTIAVDIDLSTETYFEAMELKNDPDIEIEDGVFFEYCWVEPGNEDWWENDWPGFTFEGAQNPDLAADGGNCYVICEVDGDIVCYYSHDSGESFQTSTVATNGQFPAVSAIGETVICTFARNGDIYAAKSKDGGVTWEEFPPFNAESGSVVEQEFSLDIAGSYIVWTDNRNGDKEIYYTPVGTPPAKPAKPDGPTSGDVNNEHTYTTSSTDPDGDQIYYVFDWGDGTTTDAGPYNSGETGSASHKWGSQGNYNIKVKARDSTGFESDWSDPLSVSMPRNKISSNPLFIQFLKDLMNHFPKLMRILINPL